MAWTMEECRVADEMRSRNCTSVEIGDCIGKGSGAVRSRFHYIENNAEIRVKHAAQRVVKKEKLIAEITKKLSPFERAMVTAIRSGQEKTTIGVVKDNRPINPTRFARGMVGSGFRSPALVCCE